jgi:Amt family ammonium transporter
MMDGVVFLKEAGKLSVHNLAPSIPESVFAMFQMTFAIITPALITGAFAERMKFSAMLIFSAVWFTFSYLPICHMAWAGVGGIFWDLSVLDFAGGTVVHINAGIAALVCCLVMGKRRGYPEKPMPPHSLPLAVTGAGMLWVGWFGFNAGSAAAANGAAGYAMLVTQLATAVAALTWMFIEWIKNGKPSALGIITGAVAGLVAITPASGSSGIPGAILIGFVAALVCFFAATSLKRALGYDDSLDAFGVHGVGGVVGALLTGIACNPEGFWRGGGFGAGIESVGGQLSVQFISVIVTIAVSGIVSLVTLLALKYTIGLTVSAEEEEEGLDQALHGEEAYHV